MASKKEKNRQKKTLCLCQFEEKIDTDGKRDKKIKVTLRQDWKVLPFVFNWTRSITGRKWNGKTINPIPVQLPPAESPKQSHLNGCNDFNQIGPRAIGGKGKIEQEQEKFQSISAKQKIIQFLRSSCCVHKKQSRKKN